MNWTKTQIEEAHRIVNDIAEGITKTETFGALRTSLAIYADLLDEARQKRRTEETQQLLEAIESLQEREGFVNLAILPEGLRAEVEQAAEVWRTEAQTRRQAWQREVLGLGVD